MARLSPSTNPPKIIDLARERRARAPQPRFDWNDPEACLRLFAEAGAEEYRRRLEAYHARICGPWAAEEA